MSANEAPPRRTGAAFAGDIAVVSLVLGFAIARLFAHLDAPEDLWRGVLHDRHGHYAYGLDLAVSIATLNLDDAIWAIAKPAVWPPFHGMVLSAVLLVSGFDWRLGVVPSLCGWALMVCSVWQIALRLFLRADLAAVAGFVAVGFALSSPSLALLSSDVMLEGLGAGLSAGCIYAFIAACQEPTSRWRWRLLGLVATLLFFEKYNYWVLAIVAITLAALAQHPGVRMAAMSFVAWLLRSAPMMLRRPAALVCLALLCVVAAIGLHGPVALRLAGTEVQLYPPFNLLTAAYAAFFILSLQLWREHRERARIALGTAGTALLLWHALPVAASFLVPRRLGSFVWFLAPSNADERLYHFDPIGGLWLYLDAFLNGFSTSPATGWLCLALVAPALAFPRSMRAEWLVVPIFLAVSVAAMLLHPQQQARFLATSIFGLWLAAGAGAAIMVGALAGRRSVPAILAGVAAAAVLIGNDIATPYRLEAYRIAARSPSGPSDLAIPRAYLPYVDPNVPAAIIATFGGTKLLDWPVVDACHCRFRSLSEPLSPQADREEIKGATATLLAGTHAFQLLVADFPSLTRFPYAYDNTRGIVDAMFEQNRFTMVRTIEVVDPPGTIFVLRR